MPSYRELKSRIGGVQNIQQITRAMKMVAAARLRRSEEAVLAFRPYASRIEGLCAKLLTEAAGTEHPFMVPRTSGGVAVLTICSDRGLCGAYNNRIIQAAAEFLEARRHQKPFVVAVGHRGVSGLKRAGGTVHRAFEDVFNPVRYETAGEIVDELTGLFADGRVAEVFVIFATYFSPLRQNVTTRRLLPCPPAEYGEDVARFYGGEQPEGVRVAELAADPRSTGVAIYEPAYEVICGPLLRHNLVAQVYRALLEAQVSEHGARMMAMDNATENADEMIEELTLLMNRIRQEDITTEILDVVGGAEAL